MLFVDSFSEDTVRLVVVNLPLDGRVISASGDDAWARAAAEVAVESAVDALKVRLAINPVTVDRDKAGREMRPRATGEVRVHAIGELWCSRICERCGEEVRLHLNADEQLQFLPEGSVDPEREEIEEEELDVGWYDGGELSLESVVAEMFTLALPVKVTCADEVACQVRTMALLEANRLAAGVGHPAFAALKNLC